MFLTGEIRFDFDNDGNSDSGSLKDITVDLIKLFLDILVLFVAISKSIYKFLSFKGDSYFECYLSFSNGNV